MNTHFFFLVPLIVGSTSGYIFKNSADEMAYLTGIITAVSFILGLILAPWQIQIFVLALVILVTRRLLVQNEQHSLKFEENKEQRLNVSSIRQQLPASTLEQVKEATPERKYRGASFQHNAANGQVNSSVPISKIEITGKYRGGTWNSNKDKDSKTKPTPELKYRGASVNSSKPQDSNSVDGRSEK